MIPDLQPPQKTVLVVDDDDLALSATATLLEDLGFRTIARASPERALTSIRMDKSINLLLTDLMMPGMSGAQLISEALRESPDLAIILASGYAVDSRDLADRAVVLRKPYRMQELVRAVGEAMSRATGD